MNGEDATVFVAVTAGGSVPGFRVEFVDVVPGGADGLLAVSYEQAGVVDAVVTQLRAVAHSQ